ncbi:MAG TPA: SusC/RagA family TonB-linked outer membrane protein [Gemmatimonadaceae bacterium]|nr:SusC/RagA family TonB-linked outer membrane protein [Gemmatimonadaceae bacterium]
MIQHLVRKVPRLSIAAGALLLSMAATARSQDAGVITGVVRDATTRAPIASAQVQIVNTTRATIAGDDGTFRIANVRPGQYQIRALRLGFQSSTQPAQVTAGGTTALEFALAPAAVSLEEVVTTATGETSRKREIGSAVATIAPKQQELATAQSVSQLLTGKVAGVDVASSGGTVGSGSRIRIRGANSLSLTNEPLIIVDGIRFNNSVGVDNTSGAGTIGVGGQVPSRFNDINPEDIESIEVLKGPAAAAQYGTAAANGVFQIKTKRGRSGKARWTTFVESGSINDHTDYPANYQQIGINTPAGTRAAFCSLDSQTRGLCTPIVDSLISFNPLVQASPFRSGLRSAYGASVNGGTDQITYYIAGNYDKQRGVFVTSQDQRASGRANLSVQLRDNWNLSVGTSYLANHLHLPQNDNNTLGIISAGLLGTASDDPVGHGYLNGLAPPQIYNINTHQDVQRFENSINSSFQPLSWLTATGVAGLDYLNRYDNEVIPPQKVSFGSLPDGQRTSNPYQIYNYTANGTLSASFTPFEGLKSTTKASGLFNKELIRGTRAFGAKLVAGTLSLQGTTARFAVGETSTDNKTVSVLGSEDLAWRDRIFLSGAIRNDKNSAFGQNFGSINYPSVTLSWVVNEESWFPKNNLFNSLRLRAANGRSGQKPTFRDAITFFNAQTVTVGGTDVAGITVGGTGNKDLRPEKSRETELGFDAGFLGERIGFEVTHYNKRTDDLLIAVPLAPSLGLTTTQFKNLGSVSNKGWELLVNAKVIDIERIAFDFGIATSTNDNKLLSLGLLAPGKPVQPIVVNTQQQHREGLPLGAYFQRSITFADANGDGIIARSEITLSDTAVYMGNPLPRHQLSFSPNLTLFKLFRVAALIDHKDGYKLFNNTRRFRCSFGNCPEAYVRTAPLADQAAAIAIALGTDAGYIEDANFTKLRELSFSIAAPERFTQAFGGRNLELTIAGRNLHTWTKYTGFDPEVNSSPGANFSTSDFLTLPPTRTWTARLTMSF